MEHRVGLDTGHVLVVSPGMLHCNLLKKNKKNKKNKKKNKKAVKYAESQYSFRYKN